MDIDEDAGLDLRDDDDIVHQLTVLVSFHPRDEAIKIGGKNMNLKKILIRAYLYTQVSELVTKVKSTFGARAEGMACTLYDSDGMTLASDVPLLSLAFIAGFVGHHNQNNTAVVRGKDLKLYVEYELK